ncbi:MAG: hypothetical protein ABI689_17700, partial [Thermoanaerobaculia bacterium]
MKRFPQLVSLGALLALVVSPAHGGSLVFRDGFESGSVCAWGGACAPPSSVAGSWLFDLDFSGQERTYAVLLHQRAGGKVVGYMLGATAKQLVTAASYTAGVLTLDLLFERPDGDRTVHLVASVSGAVADGTVTGALGVQPVHLARWPEPLEERRWVVLDLDAPPGFGGLSGVQLGVALRPDGSLMAGSFAAAELAGCLWACDGGITAFTDDGTTASFGLETDGGCSAGSVATLTFDPGGGFFGFWTGSASFTDCSGTKTGPILGSPATATTSDDATQVLAAVARVADQLESATLFAAPHLSFANDFFHEGRDLPSTLADLNGEIAAWNDIEVDLSRVRRISTMAVSNPSPLATRPHGIDLDETRSGVPVGGGGREVYLDPADNLLDDIQINPLARAAPTTAGWKLAGDHQPAFDLPLVTDPVGPLDTTLRVSTPGGKVYVSLAPFGAHFQPLTGHAYGNAKPDLAGFLIENESELDELIGDGDGVCEAGETCGYWGGFDGSLVRNRIPTYIAPHDGLVTAVVLDRLPTGVYFDDAPHWVVYVTFPANVEYRFVHVGAIAPVLAGAIAAASGCDPRSWQSCPGVGEGSDLLEGLAPIPVAHGTPLAQPQVFADDVPGFPGYHVGGGSYPEFPWAQMEVFTSLPIELRIDGCTYPLYPTARQAALRGVMERDMLDPASLRYRDRVGRSRWKWSAEATPCAALTSWPSDYRSLLTHHGGWYERSGAGTTPDEIVSFVQMFPQSAVFDPGNYGAGTEMLILRQRQSGLHFSWTMPDLGVVQPFFPAGEIRELNGDSFLVAWRELAWTAGDPPAYQRATYRLDDNGLTIRWGAFAANPGSAVQPILLPGAACDELDV